MKFKGQFTVLGAKGFKGNVDGTNYDSTTLYVVMDVSEKNGNEVGQNAVPLKFGTQEEFLKMKHLFAGGNPIQAELEINATTKGYEVTGFKPINVQRPAA